MIFDLGFTSVPIAFHVLNVGCLLNSSFAIILRMNNMNNNYFDNQQTTFSIVLGLKPSFQKKILNFSFAFFFMVF